MDPVVVLREVDKLGIETDVGAVLTGPVAQDGFETDLGDEQARRRAQVLDTGVVVRLEIRQFLSGEGLHRHDRALLDELEIRSGLNLLVNPDGTEDLHGALVEGRGARVDGRSGVPLDYETVDAVRAEQSGRGEADQAPAHDEYGFSYLRHSASKAERGAGWFP